ncbi:GD22041 [Drosophila simulans]|uniref:GD22041 n=1 Tax=Drosophila simulans TaxID=7240 RepID=B4Q566_DROSI|nr:GD22041 [Drosophila simulans]
MVLFLVVVLFLVLLLLQIALDNSPNPNPKPSGAYYIKAMPLESRRRCRSHLVWLVDSGYAAVSMESTSFLRSAEHPEHRDFPGPLIPESQNPNFGWTQLDMKDCLSSVLPSDSFRFIHPGNRWYFTEDPNRCAIR